MLHEAHVVAQAVTHHVTMVPLDRINLEMWSEASKPKYFILYAEYNTLSTLQNLFEKNLCTGY